MNQKKNLKGRKEKGITLVALVVTVVVLLILAGITITYVLGDNGIFNKATESKEQMEEQKAREKLETSLANLYIQKNSEKEGYNEKEYIDKQLLKENMHAIEDIVIVDGYQFQIDRTVPKIVNSLGKGTQNEKIQIGEASIDYATFHYVKANVQVEITYSGEIGEIMIGGKSIEVPISQDGVYTIKDEIEANGRYSIIVKDKEGNYKIGTIEVKDITEDMDIWNKADMESFRDKVNAGRTFEKRTVRVMDNIELNGSQTEQWIPVGNEQTEFKGTFEGNGKIKTIKGIYINSSLSYQGLFRTLGEEGRIQNISVQGTINANSFCGGIVGSNYGTITQCYNLAEITGNDCVGGIVGDNYKKSISKCGNLNNISGVANVGGITGALSNSNASISECFNLKSVTASNHSAGGIVGYATKGKIYNCYNTGTITNRAYEVGGISGAGGVSGFKVMIYNCYNVGTIQGGQNAGQIVGLPTANGGSTEVVNCYQASDVSVQGLNSREDSNNVWTEDIKEGDDTWKYNSGYPILKWQLEKSKY